jgi:threonyl-tRNA synthetase
MLVVGDREAAEGTVSVRSRRGGDQGSKPVTDFMEAARMEVQERRALTAASELA